MIASFSPFILETSWQKALKEELGKPYLLELAAFVEKEYAQLPGKVFPPQELIFNSFIQTPLKDVRVVIVGQDPYHGVGQAHGLCFSVPKGVKAPPSLQNIFKELHSDLGIEISKHGCLLEWTKQGVLLLNATLTVRESEPLSHHGIGWERFTDAVLHVLKEEDRPIAFLLWGKHAQDKCRFLKDDSKSQKHLILTAAHPSPFSANNGFFGCRHFSQINVWLEKQGNQPIRWSL